MYVPCFAAANSIGAGIDERHHMFQLAAERSRTIREQASDNNTSSGRGMIWRCNMAQWSHRRLLG
jgi:hypothetical protein